MRVQIELVESFGRQTRIRGRTNYKYRPNVIVRVFNICVDVALRGSVVGFIPRLLERVLVPLAWTKNCQLFWVVKSLK